MIQFMKIILQYIRKSSFKFNKYFIFHEIFATNNLWKSTWKFVVNLFVKIFDRKLRKNIVRNIKNYNNKINRKWQKTLDKLLHQHVMVYYKIWKSRSDKCELNIRSKVYNILCILLNNWTIESYPYMQH